MFSIVEFDGCVLIVRNAGANNLANGDLFGVVVVVYGGGRKVARYHCVSMCESCGLLCVKRNRKIEGDLSIG